MCLDVSVTNLRRKRSNTYDHVQGCHGNVQGSCPDGIGCGSTNAPLKCTGSSCTLTRCRELATNNNADGFAYRRSANQYCRLCTFAELIEYSPEIDYGIYSRVPRMYKTKTFWSLQLYIMFLFYTDHFHIGFIIH